MDPIKLIFRCLFAIHSVGLFAQIDYLSESLRIHNPSPSNSATELRYQENNRYFSHSMNPWDVGHNLRKGIINLKKDYFFKIDTLTTASSRNYYTQIKYDQDSLLIMPYGRQALKEVTFIELEHYPIKTLPYSPLLVLNKFSQKRKTLKIEESPLEVIYSGIIGDYTIDLHINKTTYEVIKISTLSDLSIDDQYYGFGDVRDTYLYHNYTSHGGLKIPKLIVKQELNNQLLDTVRILDSHIISNQKNITLERTSYTIKKEQKETPDISIDQYSENIYLINLHHCGTRSLLVEFEDFLLVAESPLNSQYGEQLISEIKSIIPNKPIRYFTFGHFHPHYTGGIRPFIHREASIICIEEDTSYINAIANAVYSLDPDSLALDPQDVKYDILYQAKTITDGIYDMTIYHIGKKSNHTSDYLIYYFPKEKMIFEDDLVWIDENTTKDDLSDLTKGLYQSIKDLNLDVQQIVQNWHVFDKENKMIFEFIDIEKIMTE